MDFISLIIQLLGYPHSRKSPYRDSILCAPCMEYSPTFTPNIIQIKVKIPNDIDYIYIYIYDNVYIYICSVLFLMYSYMINALILNMGVLRGRCPYIYTVYIYYYIFTYDIYIYNYIFTYDIYVYAILKNICIWNIYSIMIYFYLFFWSYSSFFGAPAFVQPGKGFVLVLRLMSTRPGMPAAAVVETA